MRTGSRPTRRSACWAALRLYREGYARAIVSSGSQHGEGLRQAELQAAWLERAGVPSQAIVVENGSTRTYESGIAVKRIMAEHGWKSAVMVTSQMDVPRVRLVFRKLGVTVTCLPVPEFRRPRGPFISARPQRCRSTPRTSTRA